MKIIPAIDIIDGQCVRLQQGDYQQKTIYSKNPVEVALNFQDQGITHLHLVDLDGAKSKQVVNYKVLNKIASCTQLKIDFGGGIKRDEDLKIAFENGAQQVTLGSIAVSHPEQVLCFLEKYGPDKLLLGADCKNNKIQTQGWLENSDLEVVDFVQAYVHKGFREVISTDISKDGMLAGPSYTLYTELLKATKAKVIASGGVSCIKDVYRLKDLGCSGVIIGKALYEGKITLKELRELC